APAPAAAGPGPEGRHLQGSGGPHAAGPAEQGAREPEEAAEARALGRAGRKGLVTLVRRLGGGSARAALLLLASTALAAEIEFTASVDQTTVGLGEQFQLVLSVRGEDMLSAPSPTLPAVPGLNVL